MSHGATGTADRSASSHSTPQHATTRSGGSGRSSTCTRRSTISNSATCPLGSGKTGSAPDGSGKSITVPATRVLSGDQAKPITATPVSSSIESSGSVVEVTRTWVPRFGEVLRCHRRSGETCRLTAGASR